MSLFEDYKMTVVAGSTAADTSAVESSSVDMLGFKDVVFVASITTAATDNILKLQGSDDDSTFADIDGAVVAPGASDGVQYVRLVKPAKRYIKAVITRDTSSAVDLVVAFQGDARIDPQDNSGLAGVTV